MKKLIKILLPIFILWLFLNDGSHSNVKELIWVCLMLFFAASIVATLGLSVVRGVFWVAIYLCNDIDRKAGLLKIYAKTENVYLVIATFAIAVLLGVPGYSQSFWISIITFLVGFNMSYTLLYKGTIDNRDSLNFDLLKGAPKHF
jgi:hypothetical protein